MARLPALPPAPNWECVLNECTCVDPVDYKACNAAMPTPVAGLKATPKLKPSQQWAIEETGGKLWTMV
ncbi:hypothetical protein B296_00008313 [Ensete ventricosum]|uniref:Uncharacterized protein n=1 Tax=Ensete ventricosum TaxID=4639 RepID=A0A427AW23_ENSVE|nr:hypothetical protein B296_00008313 [Ensete ventricosum]